MGPQSDSVYDRNATIRYKASVYKARGRDMEPRDLCTIKDIKEKQNLPLKGIICELSGEYRWGTTSRVDDRF